MEYITAQKTYPMPVERYFLGWDAPVTAKVREFLLPQQLSGPVDLGKDLIVVPTRQAGRRLREALAKNERQLVVLDDVLSATDAGRLARVMTVLEEVAQRLQILILTCHQERYRGLEQANFIDLEAIIRNSLAT